jgi:hypothetical protein
LPPPAFGADDRLTFRPSSKGEGIMAYTGATRAVGGFLIRDAAPRRDQRGEPAVLCRIGQHGTTGEWSAEDAEGNQLEVRSGADGRLEIAHYPNAGEDQQGELGMRRPPGAAGEIPGQAEDWRRAADRELLRPDRRGVGTVAGNLAMQRELDRVYARR